MPDPDDPDGEYKVLVRDADETSTATFFRGADSRGRAGDHFAAARGRSDTREAWLFRRVGDGWQPAAHPLAEAEGLGFAS